MKSELDTFGFKIIESIYTEKEIDEIVSLLESEEIKGQFGVREFLYNYPSIKQKVFNSKLLKVIKRISPKCKKSIKSIYFDKPPSANWIVNWHQDLTINLSNRIDIDQYKNWRKKDKRFVVQPNKELLEKIFTIRIHLDNCTALNGALRVVEKSHTNGVVDIKEWIDSAADFETVCEVNKGGILLMKPLLFHSSKRTENQMNRRVIHVEFTDQELPIGLEWKEKVVFEE